MQHSIVPYVSVQRTMKIHSVRTTCHNWRSMLPISSSCCRGYTLGSSPLVSSPPLDEYHYEGTGENAETQKRRKAETGGTKASAVADLAPARSDGATKNCGDGRMRLSRRVVELVESATLAVSAKAARMKAEGVDVVSFGAGEPDFDTPAHIRQAAIDALHAGQTKYPSPASGIAVARKAVCESLARDAKLRYSPEQVIITSGGKDAAYMAFHALLDPGDEVVIPKPYWVSYPEMVRLAGGVPVFTAGSEKNDYKLTPQVLRSVLTARTRMFIFNSPSNPSGVTYHPEEVRALAQVLQDCDLIVLSDEIYDQLLYDGQKTISFAAVSDRAYAQTLTCNSASKTYAMTGWRLGYAAGPVEIIKAMAKLQSQSTSRAATFRFLGKRRTASSTLPSKMVSWSFIKFCFRGYRVKKGAP